MSGLYHNTALRIVKCLDAVLLTIPFAACWIVWYAPETVSPYYSRGNWLIIAIYLALYVIYGRVYEGFMVSIYRISEMVYSQALAAFLSDAILYLVIWLLTKSLPAVWPLLLAFAGQILLAAVWAYCVHRWYFAVFPPRKTVIVYDERRGMEDLIGQYGLDKKFQVMGTATVEECLAQNLELLSGAEVAFLCGIHSHDRNIILKYCIAHGVQVYMLPRIGDVLVSSAKPMHLFHLPMLRVTRYNPPPEYLFIKRLFDVVASGLVLIVVSPIMVAVAIAIKATDGGPVFYKQCRLTQNGRAFMVHKFRSMRVDAEKDGVARLSTGDKDDRITPVGRFIRKVRIDELPQLLDILKGDMSVVGPRPERPEIAAEYMEELPEFALRLQAKAGLTGYAQVYGKYNTTPYDKLQMDLMYIANPSLVEDLRIIFATIKILFVPESTEGVGEGQITAMGDVVQMGDGK